MRRLLSAVMNRKFLAEEALLAAIAKLKRILNDHLLASAYDDSQRPGVVIPSVLLNFCGDKVYIAEVR